MCIRDSIDAAQIRLDLLDQGRALGQIAHIRLIDRAGSPGFTDFGGDGLGPLGVAAIVDGHFGPQRPKLRGNGRADAAACIAPLADVDTTHCVTAERAFSRALGGSCQVPLGGYAIIENGPDGDTLWLRGFVATADGTEMVSGELYGKPEDADIIGRTLAQMLRDQGADAILEKLAACN